MKCMLCPATFETQEIETGFTDPAKAAAAAAKVRAQQDEGEKWEHLRVTVTRDGGQFEVLAGYLCPSENVQVDGLTIATK